VIVAGAGFIVAGIVLAVRGMLRKFESNLNTGQMSDATEKTVAGLGIAGQTARGVIFVVVGGFLIDAAVTFDPKKARGLDGALRTLGSATAGGCCWSSSRSGSHASGRTPSRRRATDRPERAGGRHAPYDGRGRPGQAR